MPPPARPDRAHLVVSERSADTNVAVSPHYLASEAATDIMAEGGNAVDGAVAANAVLGVVLADTCGPGGDLFALIHRPGEATPLALNASGRAGRGLQAEDLRRRGIEQIPLHSPWSVTVPGCVDGWETLLSRLGRRSLDEVLAPAIALAEDGFAVSPELAISLETMKPVIGDQPSAASFYPDGEVPAPDTVIRRQDLATTLKNLISSGRSGFYQGPVGAAITAATKGAITVEDLAHNQAEWVEPATLDVFDHRAWTIPPNSQGYLTLAACWLFEQLAPPRDPEDPAYQHALIEAYRAVAWERDDLVSDAATAPLPASKLLHSARLSERLNALSAEGITSWPDPARSTTGTAYLCTRDDSGMGVSIVQSNFTGIGSGLSAGATGVFLHNRGAGFTLRPGHPNELVPGRRPRHTLSPTLWTRGSELSLLLGSRGGDYQPQLLVQVAANLLWAGLDPQQAQALPRWRVAEFGPGAPSHLLVEPRYPRETLSGLTERGHTVALAGDWMTGWGPVALISSGDGLVASADPRVSTSAAALSRQR